jgi:hypothetical protein
MSGVAFEEILEEEAKALPPEEQRQLREVLDTEHLPIILAGLLAAGLIYFLEKRNALTHDERQRLRDKLNQAALDSGVVSRADMVREVRGKYAHLPTSSQEFALQKSEEIGRENRR